MTKCVAVAWLLCAWVLWLERGELIEGAVMTYTTIGAFEGKDGCDRQVARVVSDVGLRDMLLTNNSRVETHPTGFLIVGADRIVRKATYLCLPDTVDPRGPKR